MTEGTPDVARRWRHWLRPGPWLRGLVFWGGAVATGATAVAFARGRSFPPSLRKSEYGSISRIEVIKGSKLTRFKSGARISGLRVPARMLPQQ